MIDFILIYFKYFLAINLIVFILKLCIYFILKLFQMK